MSTYRVDVGTPPEKFEGLTTIYVSIHFVNESDSSIKISYGYSVRDADGKEVADNKPETDEFDANGSNNNAWFTPDFAKRSTLMELLVQGSLVIEVRMKLPSTGNKATQFIPTNPINKNVLELFLDEETADVIFEVGGERHAKDNNNTSALYEMCGAADGEEGITTVSITDVKPEIFKHMIYYSYGGKLSKEDLEDNTKDIIDACDKYGLVHLKLEAEAHYVKSTEITINNMIDNLLYADSKNLALLKEAVMNYIVANKKRIIGKVSFSNVPGDMITDVLAATSRGGETDDDSSDDEDESTKYNKMRVGTLRKMLDEKGLDVDGSREAMVTLLKENNDSDDSDDDDDDDNGGEDGAGE